MVNFQTSMHKIKLFSSLAESECRLVENVPFTVAIDKLKICLLRNSSGIFAFQAHCPHAGASLAEAHCNTHNEIVCPLHGYRFELFSGREVTRKSCELVTYRIDSETSGVFITI
jgi:nitrite reductase/ring-hydroxylating ferredoxin subunit